MAAAFGAVTTSAAQTCQYYVIGHTASVGLSGCIVACGTSDNT